MIRAVILAGGLGTRVRPYTFTVPKPLLPLGERALLDHLIEQLVANGIRNLTLSLGYQAQLVRAYFGDGSRHGVRIDPWAPRAASRSCQTSWTRPSRSSCSTATCTRA